VNNFPSFIVPIGLLVFLLSGFPKQIWSAEPRVQIRSPKDGDRIAQEQDYLLLSGKVLSDLAKSLNVDIFLAIDVSGSTADFAGAEFPEFVNLPDRYLNSRSWRSDTESNRKRSNRNLRNSILTAEVVASRRLLSQLNPQTTRVGVITFDSEIWVRQPLTQDYDLVRQALELIYKRGPKGDTNMVDAIRVAADEFWGRGSSEPRVDTLKSIFFMTDGFPNLPSGDRRSDEDLTIEAARLAGSSGITINVFVLGERASSNPRATVGIAKESGGKYMVVATPADLLTVLDRVSAVGVEYVLVNNETMGQRALMTRLAVDGFFASAVPVVEGDNQIEVLAWTSDGGVARDTITVHYQSGKERSLALEVFLQNEKRALELEISLERQKQLKLEVERLHSSGDQTSTDIDQKPQEGLTPRPSSTAPASDGPQ